MSNRRFVVSPETLRRLWADETLRILSSPPAPIGLTTLTLFNIEVLVDVRMPNDVVAIIDEAGLRAIIHSGSNISITTVADGLQEYEAQVRPDREDKSAPIFPEEFIEPEVLLVGTKNTVGPFYKDMWKIRTDMIKEVADMHRSVGFGERL